MRLFPAGSLLFILISTLSSFISSLPTSVDAAQPARGSSSSPSQNSPSGSSSQSSSSQQSSSPTSSSPNRPRWQLQLGSGWTFEYTSSPQFFTPVQEAAVHLRYLYELVQATVRKSPNSAAGVFRLGQIGLVIKGTTVEDETDLMAAALPWEVIIAFCQAMLEEVERGYVVKYEGLISSDSGQAMSVQLEYLPELLEKYLPNQHSR